MSALKSAAETKRRPANVTSVNATHLTGPDDGNATLVTVETTTRCVTWTNVLLPLAGPGGVGGGVVSYAGGQKDQQDAYSKLWAPRGLEGLGLMDNEKVTWAIFRFGHGAWPRWAGRFEVEKGVLAPTVAQAAHPPHVTENRTHCGPWHTL